MLTQDIAWTAGMANALELAKKQRRAVVIKPLGQGCGDFDKW